MEHRPGGETEDKALLSPRMIIAAICFMVVGSVASIAEANAVPEARALIQTLGDEGTKALTDAKLSPVERRDEFRHLVQANFDIDGMAKFAIGRYGKELTASQWRTFRAVFEDFILKVYSERINEHGWDRFAVTGARPTDDGGNLVTSETTKEGRPPTSLVWRVHDTDHGPKIIDVTVEGISMAVTQRQEFTSVIQNGNGGIEGFLNELRRKASALQ
jgi:phospholipid transport system substrate-binding protein